MKRFDQLTIEDIRLHPVWRYQSVNGDATAWVDVEDRAQLSEHDSAVFIAATTFRLADGSELLGLCSPSDPSGLDYLQPVILTEAGQLPLWNEKGPGAVPADICEFLAKRATGVFPLTFECCVPVNGVLVSGTVGVDDETSAADQSLTLAVRTKPK